MIRRQDVPFGSFALVAADNTLAACFDRHPAAGSPIPNSSFSLRLRSATIAALNCRRMFRTRTIASGHRRHSSQQSSCRVGPSICDAWPIRLISGVATEAGARNGFGGPRDRTSKIAAVATPRYAETHTPSLEPREKPANAGKSGLFVRHLEPSVRTGVRGGPGRSNTSIRPQYLTCKTAPKMPVERNRLFRPL